MIKIDGSIGEGGGAITRIALGLSVLTKKPFEIFNIRKNRNNPGLQEQHLQGIKAIKKLCSAEVKGAELGSTSLSFIPGKITKDQLRIKIGTAGSIALVLQSLLIASINNNLRIRIEGGGTWNKWAPSVLYLKEVFSKMMEKFGYLIEIEILKNGFYPKGGALVEVKVKKNNLREIDLSENGELNFINCVSVATKDLRKGKVAERQANSALRILGRKLPEVKINSSINYVDSLSTGSGILLVANYSNTILGYDVVGEKGRLSEKVGEEAGYGLLKHIENKVLIDSFMLDQILPYLSLVGGKIKFLEMTEHAKTNIEVIKKFIDVKFDIKDNILKVNLK